LCTPAAAAAQASLARASQRPRTPVTATELTTAGAGLAGCTQTRGALPAPCTLFSPSAELRRHALRPDAAQAPADRWFGDDKLRHFFLSFAAANLAFGTARLAGLDRDAALPAALGTGALAGLGKEIDDARRGWHFSARDLVWDAAGLAASALLLREVR
jgi:uncharacterized protein YfiM (DUF2279 family)